MMNKHGTGSLRLARHAPVELPDELKLPANGLQQALPK